MLIVFCNQIFSVLQMSSALNFFHTQLCCIKQEWQEEISLHKSRKHALRVCTNYFALWTMENHPDEKSLLFIALSCSSKKFIHPFIYFFLRTRVLHISPYSTFLLTLSYSLALFCSVLPFKFVSAATVSTS